MGLLNPGGPIAQFKRNRCSISPVELILQSGVRSQEAYETVEGVCVAIRRAPLGGHQRIRLMDESGTAHDLLLARHQRFLIGSSYRVYLQSPPGAALPEARIPHGALLGLEDLGECQAESEIDCQAAAQEGSDIIKTERFNE